MATCAECGIKVVGCILKIVKDKVISLPGEFPLQLLSKETGFTPQLIGSSFDGYIKNALLENSLYAAKAGKPSRLQIDWKKNDDIRIS
jgi:hypothetical protein